MLGAAGRMIRDHGKEYTVRNAAGGGGGRSSPSYSDDGTFIGIIEQRGMPTTIQDSSGADIQVELEIRAVETDGITFRGMGETDHPSKAVHPSGQTFNVVATFPEDSGVTVLSVVRA